MTTQVLAGDLTKTYRRGRAETAVALDGVNLLLEGGLVAVLGPNGSGKSTLLRCLATVLRPDAGWIRIDGLDPTHESDRVEIRRRLGYMPQDPGLTRSGRVFDVLDYFAVLKGHRDERARRQMVFSVLDEVGLRDRASDKVEQLSGGMARRLGVAQALLGQPGLLILDEPSANLDPDERFRLRQIINARRLRTTTIISTHLTEEATGCETILVMAQGSLRFVGSPQALATTAAGCAWIQSEAPREVRASWQLPDGSHRCLGNAPVGATLVEPTVEDGYLLVQRSS